MSNVPPGAFMLPYAITFCEWLVKLAGGIATCVESSEMVVDYMVTHGRIPVSTTEDISLTNDLIARGQASPAGATDSVAASQQMTRLGIPNTQYGADWFAANDFVPVVEAALKRGVPVLFGIYAAHNLHDDWTNQNMDAGVDGHGIVIVGMDSTGAIVADPNTLQAEQGNFVHYSWDNLRGAEGSYPSMVIPEAVVALDISQAASWFTAQADGSWKCIQTGKVLATGMLDTYRNMPAFGSLAGVTALGYPLTDMIYQPEGGCGIQVFSRGILVWDPNQKLDKVAGQLGDYYMGHIDDPKFNTILAQAQAEVVGLEAEIAKLSSPKTPADIVAALAAATSLLAPFAQAAAEVAKAQTEVVS